jgi:hypothetical protein
MTVSLLAGTTQRANIELESGNGKVAVTMVCISLGSIQYPVLIFSQTDFAYQFSAL